VLAAESRMKGTATIEAAVIKFLVFIVVFQGSVADPPIIAKDSISAVGATAVKNVD
jgi:hypothetical protein